MLAVSLMAVAHARQRTAPTTLSPGYGYGSTIPQDPHARKATIAAMLARRAEQPRVPSVAELTERQSTSTTELARSAYTPLVEYIPLQHPGRRRVEAVAGAVSAARSSEEVARERRGRIGEPNDPLAPTADFPNGREFSTGSRCGESWDDAAVKCGKECLSGCNGVQEMCYLDLPICDHINPAGRCWAYSGGVSDSWCVTASAMIDGSERTKDKERDFYNLCICEEIVVGPEATTEKYLAPMNASNLPPRDEDLVAMVIEEGNKHPGLPECTSLVNVASW